MTFDQIRTFLAVANAGNFTRAAQQLYLSQPAVSQHVLALEKHLGRQLFDRKGRSLVLTLAGHRFASYAQTTMMETDTLMADMRALDDPLQGIIAVGSIHAVGVYVLPAAIARFQQAHPTVRIELKIGNTEQIGDDLQRGILDLAILDTIVPPSSSRQLRRDDFSLEEGALIVPPGHPWAGRDDIDVHEVYEQAVVMRERGSRSRGALEAELARLGIAVAELRVSMELGNTEAIKQAVASGLGVGFVPLCAIQRELEWGVLARAELARGGYGRQLWLYSPIRQGQAQRLKLFRDFLLAG